MQQYTQNNRCLTCGRLLVYESKNNKVQSNIEIDTQRCWYCKDRDSNKEFLYLCIFTVSIIVGYLSAMLTVIIYKHMGYEGIILNWKIPISMIVSMLLLLFSFRKLE